MIDSTTPTVLKVKMVQIESGTLEDEHMLTTLAVLGVLRPVQHVMEGGNGDAFYWTP